MAVDIKQLHRRLLEEVYGKGNFDVFDEICEPKSFRAHDPVTGDSDLRQEKENARMYRTAFPDLKPTILASYVDGDTVVTQWRMTGTHSAKLMDVEPTNARCTVEGISIAKFRGGKLVEDFTQWDALGLFRQLGVAPSVQPGAGARAGETRPRT
jgi:predicted ester cyclase